MNAQCYDWYQKLIPLIEKEHKMCKALLRDDESVAQDDTTTTKDRAFMLHFNQSWG